MAGFTEKMVSVVGTQNNGQLTSCLLRIANPSKNALGVKL